MRPSDVAFCDRTLDFETSTRFKSQKGRLIKPKSARLQGKTIVNVEPPPLQFSTADGFKQWWGNPLRDFERNWKISDFVQKGAFGSVRKFRVIIGDEAFNTKTEYTFAVKVLQNTSFFTQNLGAFNANMAKCQDVMPCFQIEQHTLPPRVIKRKNNDIICLMGLWSDTHTFYNPKLSPAIRQNMCAALMTLHKNCETHNIALPDFKLENLGYKELEGNKFDIRLLDLDSVAFMDNCFHTATLGANVNLTCTYIPTRKMALGAATYKNPLNYSLHNAAQDQLRYLTTALFFLFMSPIFIGEPIDKWYVERQYHRGFGIGRLFTVLSAQLNKTAKGLKGINGTDFYKNLLIQQAKAQNACRILSSNSLLAGF